MSSLPWCSSITSLSFCTKKHKQNITHRYVNYDYITDQFLKLVNLIKCVPGEAASIPEFVFFALVSVVGMFLVAVSIFFKQIACIIQKNSSNSSN